PERPPTSPRPLAGGSSASGLRGAAPHEVRQDRGMGDVLRVVQLNCGSLIEPGWDERRHEVVAWLDRLAPDVVCLQEVWATGDEPSTAHWIAEAAAGRWHVAFDGAPFDPRLWPDESMRFG